MGRCHDISISWPPRRPRPQLSRAIEPINFRLVRVPVAQSYPALLGQRRDATPSIEGGEREGEAWKRAGRCGRHRVRIPRVCFLSLDGAADSNITDRLLRAPGWTSDFSYRAVPTTHALTLDHRQHIQQSSPAPPKEMRCCLFSGHSTKYSIIPVSFAMENWHALEPGIPSRPQIKITGCRATTIIDEFLTKYLFPIPRLSRLKERDICCSWIAPRPEINPGQGDGGL
jgi:hypothetical protein